MKNALLVILLSFLLDFLPQTTGKLSSPPGKPTLIRCRSPEKETFTCWWEPGSDGGLPTTYALFYRKENSETVHECPDYETAGENSCFFNKNNTSIWVNYNITVVATNALGRTFSEPVDIDVAYIVKPNPPENLTATVMEDKGWPYLWLSWEPPRKTDTRSGWITLVYEIRVRLEEKEKWEVHYAGQQKIFNIFSIRSGGTYQVQVRCKPDHGFWSEWSFTSSIKVPDYFNRDKSMWILITVFSAFIFLILTWLLHVNSRSLKHYILPPVPGPKIKGFDDQLLKNGRSGEIFSNMVVSAFPPNTSNFEEVLVEYLEVYVPDDHELMLDESCLKFESSTSDSDSGRGSCNSHSLLMEKCGESKEDEMQPYRASLGAEPQRRQEDWEEEMASYAHESLVGLDMSGGRVKTWPSLFTPDSSSIPLDQQRSPERSRQHCLSDGGLPSGSTPSYLTQPAHNSKEDLGHSYWEFCSSGDQPDLLRPRMQHLQAHSDVNISTIGCEQPPVLLSADKRETAPVWAVTSGCCHDEGCPIMPQGEDYSKVKGVDPNNRLLLQREAMEEGRCLCDVREIPMQKPTAGSIHNQTGVTGYVDTSAMSSMPTY
ncbi:prolactin receptor a [Antennarius striatus]|uniref:prolactin receptor a n=1 Tax=Antennarius striatus TaxID=241820 RepID=UPI0035B38629